MHTIRVLLIDDSASERDRIREILSHDLPPIQLSEITSHVQFFRALKAAAFDLVIAAQKLHWSTGPEVASAVASLLPMVPVIVIAGTRDEAGEQAARSSGAAAYVVTDDELAEQQLRAAIRRELQLAISDGETLSSPEVVPPEQAGADDGMRVPPQASKPAGSGAARAVADPPEQRPTEADEPPLPPPQAGNRPLPSAAEGAAEAASRLLDDLGVGLFQMRLDGVVVSANAGFTGMTRLEVGTNLHRCLADSAQYQRILRRLEKHGAMTSFELRVRVGEASERLLLLNAAIRHAGDELIVEGITTDATTLYQQVEGLQQMSEGFRTIVQCSGSATAIVDADGTVVLGNAAFAALAGVERDAVEGIYWPDLVAEEDTGSAMSLHREALDGSHNVPNLEATLIDRHGARHEVRIIERRLPGGGRTVLSLADLTRIREAEQQLLHHAFHDGLTGLPNRLYLFDRLTDLLERDRGNGADFALILLDLDRFSVINDGLGHLVGDELLRAVGERLEATVEPTDTLASLGGDTFAVVIESESAVEEVVAAATLLRSAFAEPFPVARQELHCTASMGIVTAGQGSSADELMRHAAAALERARHQGRNRWVLFSPEISEDATRVFRVEQALRRAVAASQLRIHLQPVQELEGLRIAGFEALLRWQETDTGLLEPSQFLAVAEESGLIVPIGEWTITAACRQVVRWQRKAPGSRARIGVNLSYQQLASPGLVPTIQAALEATGIDPGRLVLEVNQSAIMRDPEHAVATVEALGELGVRLCLDNFGTGSSVLAHAHRFPFEMIKIDRSFMIGIGNDELRWKVVEQIHTLARHLADRVVVQGVEHEEQLQRLAKIGCVLVQGRLLSVPMEPKDAEHLLTKV